MRLNIRKSKTMRISRRLNPPEASVYTVEARQLEETKSDKYLGIHLTHSLY